MLVTRDWAVNPDRRLRLREQVHGALSVCYGAMNGALSCGSVAGVCTTAVIIENLTSDNSVSHNRTVFLCYCKPKKTYWYLESTLECFISFGPVTTCRKFDELKLNKTFSKKKRIYDFHYLQTIGKSHQSLWYALPVGIVFLVIKWSYHPYVNFLMHVLITPQNHFYPESTFWASSTYKSFISRVRHPVRDPMC